MALLRAYVSELLVFKPAVEERTYVLTQHLSMQRSQQIHCPLTPTTKPQVIRVSSPHTFEDSQSKAIVARKQ